MKRKANKNGFSTRNVVLALFIMLILGTAGLIGYILFSEWFASSEEITEKMNYELNNDVFVRLNTFIAEQERFSEINQEIIRNGIVDFDNEAERDIFFVSTLKGNVDDIYSFSYGTENGEYYGARRNESGNLEIMRNNANTSGNSWYYSVTDKLTAGQLTVQAGKFDPRTRDWYKAAKEAGKPVFSQIYKHFIMDDLALSLAYPVYGTDSHLQGVLGTHITLSSLNNYLEETVKINKGLAVIIEKNSGYLVANSLNERNVIILKDGTFKRLKLDEINNQDIFKAYNKYLSTGETNFLLDNKNNSQYFYLTEFHKSGLDWVVITAIPESLLMDDIFGNVRQALLLVILAVILSIIIYSMLANKLISPVYILIEVIEKLSQGDLSQRLPQIRNDEFNRISVSFNKMADTIHMLVNDLEATVRERTAELQAANDSLRQSRNDLRLILDSTAEGIYGIDTNGACTFINNSGLKLLGYERHQDLLGKKIHEIIHHSTRGGSPISIDKCNIYDAFMKGKCAHEDDEVFFRADGTSFDVEYHSYPQYKDGKVVGAVVTFVDNTEHKINEEKIRYLSFHDPLTGLYNRSHFNENLKKLDSKENLPISVIFGDVNSLKLTNDIFGHSAGDALIVKIAEILKKVCRKEDIIARIGGDEFIILLPRTHAIDAEKIMKRINLRLSEVQVATIKCSISMGCDTKLTEDQDISIVMQNAENNMYQEKALVRRSTNSDIVNTIISTLHNRCPREKQHSENVSELCQSIGRAMKLSETKVKKLGEAGYLHDIGKIILDEDLLNKEGELTENEMKQMQQHSIIGYRILNLFDDTLDLAEGVYSHHENWNGTGYPKGLKGKEISETGRIIAVAEAYDTMTNRFTKNPLSKEEALQKMKELAGVTLDPEITAIFINTME